MATPGSALEWEGQTVLDRDGEKIGTIQEIFLVEETGRPEWALVKVGRIKGHTTLVPLVSARPIDKGVEVDVGKEVVSEAPEIEADGEPSEQQVNALYRHYGIDTGAEPAQAESSNGGTASPQATTAVQAHGGSGPQVANGTTDPRERPIGDLLKQVKEEGSTLVGQEIKLAKAEMTGKVKDVGIGAGMFGGAGYVAHLASLALMLTIIFALAEAMPAWLAALIVTVLYAAVAAGLGLTAKKRIQQAGPPIPEQTVESVKQTIETVKEEAKWGLGQTR
jgi:sporulation protein YlmC with PRC-barrel domain